MDSKILLGIIAVTIFGTLGVQGMMVQAGVSPIETTTELGSPVNIPGSGSGTSTAVCPNTHPFLIGGSYTLGVFINNHSVNVDYSTTPMYDTNTNEYSVRVQAIGGFGSIEIIAQALCANFNFPMQMGMIGGELLDINTVSLLVGAIGTNPIITALVGITIAGVAGQAVWFVHRRKKNSS